MSADLDLIQNTPIARLSPAQLARLPESDLGRALGLLFDMAHDGDLAMVTANPPGTTYEVTNRAGRWILSPICQCRNEPRFIEAYYEWHGGQ